MPGTQFVWISLSYSKIRTPDSVIPILQMRKLRHTRVILGRSRMETQALWVTAQTHWVIWPDLLSFLGNNNNNDSYLSLSTH